MSENPRVNLCGLVSTGGARARLVRDCLVFAPEGNEKFALTFVQSRCLPPSLSLFLREECLLVFISAQLARSLQRCLEADV